MRWIQQRPDERRAYLHVLTDLQLAYRNRRPAARTHAYFTECFLNAPELVQLALRVINLDADVADVTDQKFYFDLDQDGEEEALSTLQSGSGFLALDRNGDGSINDGGELFGASSGNGFADLAEYDLDGNGWIDEADEVFERLVIWTPNADGTSTCYRLKEQGVGAICLQNVVTDFTLQDDSQTTNGAIRRTGIFLRETGEVGTVQHVDLVM